MTIATTTLGNVEVGQVKNLRPAGKGAQNLTILGFVRGGVGNPWAVNTDPAKDLSSVLKTAALTALRSAGYADASKKGSTRLDMDLNYFWCDGYMGYKTEAVITAKLVSVSSGQVLAQKEIKASDGFSTAFGMGAMHKSFNRITGSIENGLAEFIASPEFKSAAK
jgi:hypothetical protein